MRLIIVRGIPGSGKSTYARSLVGVVHFEADMYFTKDGEYRFEAKDIGLAHQWCQEQVLKSLKAGKDVVVSNTFVKRWEVEPYLEMAKEMGAEIEIKTMTGTYGSIHGVPEYIIERMKENWEKIEEES